MSLYTTFKTWDDLLVYLRDVDHPKCFSLNYLPDSNEYALWIGNQPYYDYEKLIDLEQKEKQWLYGKLNQISSIIEQSRSESKKFER